MAELDLAVAHHPDDPLFSASGPRSRHRRTRAYFATALLCVLALGCFVMRELPWGWHKVVALVFAGLTTWTFWEWTRPLESAEELLQRLRRVQQSDFGKQLVLNRPKPKTVTLPGYGVVEVRVVATFALFWVSLAWWFTPIAPIAVRLPEVEDLTVVCGREINAGVLIVPTGQFVLPQPPILPPRARHVARLIRDDAGPYLLGLKAMAQSRGAAAAEYFDQAEKDGFDPKQVGLARAQNELFAGAFAEAAASYEKLMADPSVSAAVVTQGAMAWMLAGEWAKADRLLAAAQKRMSKDDADEQAAVAHVQSLLAVLHAFDLRKGEELTRKAREALPEDRRDSDPIAIAGINNQGVIYVLRGDYQGAEELFKGAFERWSALDEGNNPTAAAALTNLGVLDLVMGRYESADLRLHRALVVRSQGGRTADQKQLIRFDAASLYTAAAGVHVAAWNCDEAAQDTERAMSLLADVLGRDHPAMIAPMVVDARRRMLESRYLQADSLLARASGLIKRTFGAGHVNNALIDLQIAELRLLQQRPADADALARDAEKTLTGVFSAKHVSVGRALWLRGRAAVAEERPRDARPLFDRALQINRDHLGREHPEVAMVMGCLAALDNSPATYPNGLDQYARAIKLIESAWPEPHPWAAQLYVGMAQLHLAREKHAEAVPLLERALDIQAARLTPFHPDLAATRELLADVLEKQTPPPTERIGQLRRQAKEGRNQHRIEDRSE